MFLQKFALIMKLLSFNGEEVVPYQYEITDIEKAGEVTAYYGNGINSEYGIYLDNTVVDEPLKIGDEVVVFFEKDNQIDGIVDVVKINIK